MQFKKPESFWISDKTPLKKANSFCCHLVREMKTFFLVELFGAFNGLRNT